MALCLLSELLQAAGLPAAGADIEITGLDYDSRRIEPGFLFFAFAGSKADGSAFALEALRRGAAAIVSEAPAPESFPSLWIQVPHGRKALALMARRFYRKAEAILVTGVTGTNGKTTTCCLIDTILRTAGHTTALVGTIEYHIAGEVRKAVNTTPESLDLYRMFAGLAEVGGDAATMEVSSHALALGRVHGIPFHTAVFTNLTRDHLDFHTGMEEYFASKCLLFTGENGNHPVCAVINADDEYGRRITPAPGTRVIRYGLQSDAELHAEIVASSFDGLRLEVSFGERSWEVRSALVGRINAYNILAAFGAALAMEIPPETIVEGIARRQAVPGRFERVDEGQPFLTIVDYAHTDDALRNAIQTARSLTRGRVITVFGCGGDRDRAKRPLMGQAAGELSDFVVLTSDNPRSEDPAAIMNDALVGLRRTDVEHKLEVDREKAIRAALQEARAGEVVLIAGKGHETYQVLRDATIPFDDREVARGILREFGFSGRKS